jgi:glycosyltransferase involved in cell wall biosynthesis
MTKTMLYIIGITPNKIGGTERFARELAVQMVESGWNLVLCFETAPAERVRQYFDTANVTFEVIGEQCLPGIKQCSQLVRLILRYRPTVLVYAFNGVLSFIPWIAAFLGVRTIVYNDNSSRPIQTARTSTRAWKRALGRLITFPLDGVICVSDFVSRCVCKEGWVRQDKVHTIYNGVDIHRGKPGGATQTQAVRFRKMFAIADDCKIVLNVSWLVPEKGIDTFLYAARLVVASEPRAHFVIVGAGPFSEKYRALSCELGIERNVTWTGALMDPIQEGAFPAAHVACQLSVWQEAFGFTIVEAMSCGVPVIATRTGGIPEIVRDGANGFLVPINDPNSTSECILRLLSDDSLRDKMGHAARSDVKLVFDVRKTARGFLERLGILQPPWRTAFGIDPTSSTVVRRSGMRLRSD